MVAQPRRIFCPGCRENRTEHERSGLCGPCYAAFTDPAPRRPAHLPAEPPPPSMALMRKRAFGTAFNTAFNERGAAIRNGDLGALPKRDGAARIALQGGPTPEPPKRERPPVPPPLSGRGTRNANKGPKPGSPGRTVKRDAEGAPLHLSREARRLRGMERERDRIAALEAARARRGLPGDDRDTSTGRA